VDVDETVEDAGEGGEEESGTVLLLCVGDGDEVEGDFECVLI
jgi:hypothetical protein